MTWTVATTPSEKREMQKELETNCPEFLELLKQVSGVFGPVKRVAFKKGKNNE